ENEGRRSASSGPSRFKEVPLRSVRKLRHPTSHSVIQRKVSQRCFSSVAQKSSGPPLPIRWKDHLGFNAGGQSDPRGEPPSLSPTQKVGGPRAAASSLREIPFNGDRSSFAQEDIDRPVDRSWVSSTRHWCSFSSSSAPLGR